MYTILKHRKEESGTYSVVKITYSNKDKRLGEQVVKTGLSIMDAWEISKGRKPKTTIV